jgi:hypothetical protein
MRSVKSFAAAIAVIIAMVERIQVSAVLRLGAAVNVETTGPVRSTKDKEGRSKDDG